MKNTETTETTETTEKKEKIPTTDLMDRIEELRDSLEIDTNDLGKACQEQPVHITEIADIYAELRYNAKTAKMKYEETCAAAEHQIRENPEVFNLSKITESVVKAAVTTHGDVLTEKANMLLAERAAERVGAIVDGYHHRRSMLELEVKLLLSGLYGEVPEDYTKDFNRRKRDA